MGSMLVCVTFQPFRISWSHVTDLTPLFFSLRTLHHRLAGVAHLTSFPNGKHEKLFEKGLDSSGRRPNRKLVMSQILHVMAGSRVSLLAPRHETLPPTPPRQSAILYSWLPTFDPHHLGSWEIYDCRMHSKNPSEELITPTSLSSTSIYHLRAACARISDYEALTVEGESSVVFEKVLHYSSSNLESDWSC